MFVQLLPKELPDRVAFWPDLKQWERREIGQELRRMGLSYREVAAVIPVTKGTLSGWCRDIELSDDQRQRLSFRPSRIAAARQRGLTRREGALQRADAIRTAISN
jgi:transposase